MTLEHELFESFASEIGSFFIEAVHAASLLQIVLTCISIICVAWHFWPTFYPYDEFPRIHRPILQLLPWYGKSVAEALREGWDDVSRRCFCYLRFYFAYCSTGAAFDKGFRRFKRGATDLS